MAHKALRWRSAIGLALLSTWTATAAPSLAAQGGADEGVVPAARMDAFLREVEVEPNAGLAAYFPRRGDWTWVQTIVDEEDRRLGMGAWRFGGAETVRAIGEGGPVCHSFFSSSGEFGPVHGSIAAHVDEGGGSWRRVRGNRFVPRGASARSPVFVEWRREDGAWVVSSVGDARGYMPRLLGVESGVISRDTSLVPEGAAYAADTGWYADHRPIRMGGIRYIKYGNARRFSDAERGYLERIGVFGRVSVYAERTPGATPEVLYLPVSPGVYQPYQGFGPGPCR